MKDDQEKSSGNLTLHGPHPIHAMASDKRFTDIYYRERSCSVMQPLSTQSGSGNSINKTAFD